MEIPITFHSDEKGYFDRECPNENCLYVFKVFMEDWKEKISDEEVHCPMCGHTDTSDKWWTQKQLAGIEETAVNIFSEYVQRELDKSFRNLENSTRGNKFVKISYKPSHRLTFVNNPLGQSPEWEREVVCPKCEIRYSVIGTAYFCPCCGYNLVEESFEESLDSIVKMLDSLPEMENLFCHSYGKDKSTTMIRSIVEGSLGDLISAYQKFAEVICNQITSSEVRPNDFQMIEKGSCLFSKATGKGYDAFLTKEELSFLNLMFQRRHLMVHNGGMVDEYYIHKSNDNSYIVGQRLVIRANDILRLINTVKKLATGIKMLR